MRYHLAILAVLVATVGCKLPRAHNLPPAEMIMHPGPGVDGPGPGVMFPAGAPYPMVPQSSQVLFGGPNGMSVTYDIGGAGLFDSDPLICPGRRSFPQGYIYRLKIANLPNLPGQEFYPTLEIAPALPRTLAFLAHNAIPVQFTPEDLDQVLTGNFVTKVIYLPDEDYQDMAVAGVETLVSTRLDPGVDPIVEADRRGSIISIVRVGNKDLEVPDSGEIMAAAEGIGPSAACATGPPPGYVAGITSPNYGMPISGTPIGLPGPPHVPLGVPAGLQKHKVTNWTRVRVPGPTERVAVNVRQSPGYTYPRPANRAFIHESTMAPPAILRQPLRERRQFIRQQPINH